MKLEGLVSIVFPIKLKSPSIPGGGCAGGGGGGGGLGVHNNYITQSGY